MFDADKKTLKNTDSQRSCTNIKEMPTVEHHQNLFQNIKINKVFNKHLHVQLIAIFWYT